jgi:hypothetical protein
MDGRFGLSYEFELVPEMLFAISFEVVCRDQVVELLVPKNGDDKCIQYIWSVISKSSLASQNADTLTTLHRFFESVLSDTNQTRPRN